MADHDKTPPGSLNVFFAAASLPGILCDAHLNLSEINPAALHLFFPACNKDDIIGKNIEALPFDVKQAGRSAQYQEVLRTGKPFFSPEAIQVPGLGKKHFQLHVFKAGAELGCIFTDITEFRETEDVLRAIKEMYKSLITNMVDGFALHKIITNEKNVPVDYEFIEVNDAFERLTGLKREAILGKRITEVMPGIEKDPTDWIGRYGQVALTGKNLRLESYASLFKKWFSVAAYSPSRGYFAVITNDITTRKRAEEALRKSEAELKEAQRIGRIGSWDWDATTDTIFWSEEFSHLIGHDPQQPPPGYLEHLRLYTPESRARLDAAIKISLQTGAPYELDLELTCLDGLRRWLTVRGEVKRAANVQITGLRGTCQDVTERKLLLETAAVRRSEARLAEAQRLAHLGNWTWDIAKNKLNWSEEIYRIFGLAPNEFSVTPAAFWNFVYPDDREFVKKSLDAALLERQPFNIDHRIQRPNGEERIVHEQAKTIFDQSGKALRMYGTLQDITERKLVEGKLKESKAQLEEQKLALERKNIALQEILTQLESEKKKIQENVLANVEKLLLPTIERLKRQNQNNGNEYLEVLQKNIKELTSEFGSRLNEQKLKLSQREMEICNLIKNGLTTKEIAASLNISLSTVEDYRKDIRRKLGIKHQRVNLTIYLQNL